MDIRLKRFLDNIDDVDNLTASDVEGLTDDLYIYQENRINSVFSNAADEMGWTFEEITAWWEKNGR